MGGARRIARAVLERSRAAWTHLGRVHPRGRFSGEEPPLRSELFNADQMEQHGKDLAAAHRIAPGRGSDRLLSRLAENEYPKEAELRLSSRPGEPRVALDRIEEVRRDQ